MKGQSMEYKEFLVCLKDKIELLCSDDERVFLDTITKNNSVLLDAIIIRKEGEAATPTIYVREYYDEYLVGSDIDEIAHRIIEYSRDKRLDVDIMDFCNWERMKSSIVYKLINTEKNAKLLRSVPHREFYDLSVVYYCIMDDFVGQSATTLIYNRHMKMWKVEEEELYEFAKVNTERINKPLLRSMSEILSGLIKDGEFDDKTATELMDDIKEESICPMHVLTNEKKTYGAACVMYENILRDFADKYGDFYILPSSIHEVILVPDEGHVVPSALLRMVGEVNETQVAEEEILSYNVYRYSVHDGQIHIFNNVMLNEKIL